ncbi:hypothetical protein ACHAXH_003479 [Discostella pseudostelligera]
MSNTSINSTSITSKEPSWLSQSSWQSTTVSETLSVMLQKERRRLYASCDYLGIIPQSSSFCSQEAVILDNDDEVEPTTMITITEVDRTQLVDWCYKVIDLCNLERETVAMAMDMVDRFLSSNNSNKTCEEDMAYKVLRDRIQFQLLVVTALYVAIKTNEKTVFGSKLFSIISCDLYSISDIEDMELKLLSGLSWYISAPTSVQIANHILKLISERLIIRKSTWADILDEVQYQAEHAVRDYYFVTQRPSTVAMAAIFNALDLVEDDHDRQALHSYLLVILLESTEEYDSIEQIMTSKDRLNLAVVESDDHDGHNNEK